YDNRGTRRRRCPPRAAGGVRRARRLTVRLLHAGPDLLSGRPHPGRTRQDVRRDPRADERQHLPLRSLPEHRRRDRTGDLGTGKDHRAMTPFTYSRAADIASAVRDVASGPGAKFIAGGTNLLDLIKENVERPGRLIDINGLALREIRR